MAISPTYRPTRTGLVAPVCIDPTGARGPTPGQSRGPRWRKTSRGLYVPVDIERTPAQRLVEAAAVLRPDDALTGWAALHWQGAAWFEGLTGGGDPLAVPVVASRHLVPQQGFMVSQEFLHPDEIMLLDGLPITTSVRSVTFEMRYADSLGDALVALDMACYSDLVSLAEVAAYVTALGPVTGIQQARDALAEGEENSWSPRETRMRGVWIRRAGLPRPLCNIPVFSLDGRHVGTPDLIGPDLGLVCEYNGSQHLSLAGASADLKKESAYRDLGLECVSMLASDWGDLDGFTQRLLAAKRRAECRTTPREWTLQPPHWWTPTETVVRRRALDEWQKSRFLGYRRIA